MKSVINKTLEFGIKLIEIFSNYFISLNLNPKKFSYLDKINQFENEIESAIIIQGPIICKNNFTLETIKLYRHLYPNVLIILSTWKNQNKTQIDLLKNIGILLIQNEKPHFEGTSNINLQLESTKAALKIIKKKTKVKYVLKTRSDQRISRSFNFLCFFKSLIIDYPIKIGNSINQRLVICSLNTFYFRMYGVSDMIMFGDVNDIDLFWNIPNQIEEMVPKEKEFKFFIKNNIAEGYLVKKFMNTIDYNPKWTLQDSLIFMKKYFIVVDKEQLNLFWCKYNRWINNNSLKNISDNNKKELKFSDWICI